MTPREIQHKRTVLAAIAREKAKRAARTPKAKPPRLHESQRKPEAELKGHYVIRPPIPRDVLVECGRRADLVPLTLTAAICGDPLPGYSALDRRSMQR